MFRNTTAHANADALSRRSLHVQPSKTEPEPELVLLADHLSNSLSQLTTSGSGSKLSRVLQFQRPSKGDPELEPYLSKRYELSTYDGCVLSLEEKLC